MAVAATGAAAQEAEASAVWRVRASVPIACWVRPSAPLAAGLAAQGEVVEACNAPGGFTVSATYRALTAGEHAHVRYGDDLIALSAQGAQILRQSHSASVRSVAYRFESVGLNAPLTLTVNIQPF